MSILYKEHTNNGKHLGWYKNSKNPHYTDGGYDLTNPEIFQVTNYINDVSVENTQVLETTDVDGNYHEVMIIRVLISLANRIWGMLKEDRTTRYIT